MGATRFDIPAQSLATALDAYGAATGLEVFYDGVLAAGQYARPVHGLFTPEAALRRLLIGSGLEARATGQGSFTLVAPARLRAADPAVRSYFGLLQSEVSRALCGRAETRPRDVDLLLRIWIAASGTIDRAQLFDMATGAPDVADVGGVLRGLSLGTPPADMPQPVAVAILARDRGRPTGCPHTAMAPR
ncbi:STN domain-containing protein [Bradyrhizobium sp. 31Argb]|uniref:STN domain-containing protein n=1 Tax=Bradyrhizobium sp. 31Argb TaxID=3141247 RepID=UPI0037488B88